MKTTAIVTLLILMMISGNALATEDCAPALDFEKRRLAAAEVVNLCEAHQGKVVLIVNTAPCVRIVVAPIFVDSNSHKGRKRGPSAEVFRRT